MQTFHPSGWFLWPSFFSRQGYMYWQLKPEYHTRYISLPDHRSLQRWRQWEKLCCDFLSCLSELHAELYLRQSFSYCRHTWIVHWCKTAAEVCTLSYPVERKTNSFSFSLFWNQKQVITLCLLFFGRTHSRTSLRKYFSVSHVKWNINNLLLF